MGKRGTAEDLKTAEVIAKRYHVQDTLGHGGAATVYLVLDALTQQQQALKRLRPKDDAEHQQRMARLFEQEFYTLAQLAHPRVVEVYDFGRDEIGPYYTMELLDGGDLRELAPMPWRQACSLLRDVCSVLSLLHSRRLVHRDLTPRNVRCTRDLKAKLIDFGAMVPMGPCKHAMGTPAFSPPEVISLQALDARADLYSLGATAYYVLTGATPYSARSFAELRQAWMLNPRPPSSLVQDIPQELDSLVMSLINLDPIARPANAAEVMERLTAIASLEVDEQLHVPLAYLSTPTLVGREEQLARVRRQIGRAQRSKGGAVFIESPAGTGRSRFLDACILEGKVAGATVLRADATDAHAGDWGAVRTMTTQLLDALPDAALKAAEPHVPVLGHVLPELLGRCGAHAKSGSAVALATFDNPQELRPRVHEALCDWLLRISAQQCLMLAVDDVHRIDEPSAAFVALLSKKIAKSMLVLAVAAETGADTAWTVAVRLLSEAGKRIKLDNLTQEHTERLLSSVFGKTPNVRLLADRLYDSFQGNPRDVMQLAQHLVNMGTIRYESGAWTLPNRFDPGDWPRSSTEALKARAQKIGANAQRLAQTMALRPDESLSFEECLMLTEHRDTAQLIQSFDELVASEVLSTDGQQYFFRHQSWVSVFAEELDEDNARTLHLRLAEMFELRGDHERFRAGQHLLRAGEEHRALDAFVRFAEASKERTDRDPTAFSELLQSLPHDWFESYEASLQLCKKLRRPRKESYLLLRRLLGITAITGKGSVSYAKELLEQLYRDSGLAFYEELGDSVDASVRLQRALELAQQRFDQCPEEERVLPPGEAIAELARALIQASSYAIYCFEWRFLESLPSLEPLMALSPALGVVETTIQSVGNILSAKYEKARKGFQQILERTAQPDHAGLDEAHHRYTRFAVMYGLGLIECNFGFRSSLSWASQIEEDCFHQVNAWRIRMLYHLWQGDAQQAEDCSQRLELLQIQNSPSQHWEGTHVWREVVGHGLADNLMGVKQTIAAVQDMASRYPGWIPVLHCARGAYQRIRGDHQRALSEFECALESTEQGRHTVWPFAAGAYLTTLLALGRYERAKQLGREWAAFADSAGIGFWGSLIKMPLAIAEARLGQYEEAIGHSQAVIDTLTDLGATGFIVGSAYETRARIALLMNETDVFGECAARCVEQYRAGHNQALTAKYEKLAQEARLANVYLSREEEGPTSGMSSLDDSTPFTAIQGTLTHCQGPEQRAQACLTKLVGESNCLGGYLYTMQNEGPELSAQTGDGSPPAGIEEMVKEQLLAETSEDGDSSVTLTGSACEESSETKGAWTSRRGEAYRFVLLGHYARRGFAITGVAALLLDKTREFRLPAEAIAAVSRSLLDAGDAVVEWGKQ